MSKIEFKDKQDYCLIPGIAEEFKVSAGDLNQIKKVVNDNDDALEELKTSSSNNGYFKILNTIEERDAIETKNRKIGMLVYISEDDKYYKLASSLDNDGWEEFSTGGAQQPPELSYTTNFPEGKKIYISPGDDINILIKFTSSTYGNCTIHVLRNNIEIKTVNTAKGIISLSLGSLETEGTYEYIITASDYLGIIAPTNLNFTIVCGGLRLSSTFDSVIANTVFEENTPIKIPLYCIFW